MPIKAIIGMFSVFALALLTFNVLEKVMAEPHSLERRLAELSERIDKLETRRWSFDVTVTAYTANRSETDGTPYKTALLERPVSGWTCAVSRDLMQFLGKKVYIEGLGVRRVNDLMNARYSRRIDVFVGTKQEALKIGKVERKAVFLED